MTGEKSTRQKALSVFLSTLMVLSVVAVGGVAFAGSATAQESSSTNANITIDEGDSVTISGDTLESAGSISDQTNVTESRQIFDSLNNNDIDQGLVTNLSDQPEIPGRITEEFNAQIRYEFTEPVEATNGDGSNITSVVIFYNDASGETGTYDYGSFQSDTNFQAVFITEDGGATNSVGNAETTTGNLGKIIEISVQRFVDEYESAEVKSLKVNLVNQASADRTVENVIVGDAEIDLDQVGDSETSVQIGSDYYTSIQSAIDNAESGDTIEVDSGTYEEDLTVNKDVTIESTGSADNTELAVGDNENVEITSANAVVDGFTINKTGTGSSAGTVYFSGPGTLNNSVVLDSSSGATGIDVDSPAGEVNIEDNQIDQSDIGISVSAGNTDDRVNVDGVTVNGTSTAGIDIAAVNADAAVNVTNSDLTENEEGVRLSDSTDGAQVNIHFNTFDGNVVGVADDGDSPAATHNFTFNDFTNNDDGLVIDDNSGTVNANYSWWDNPHYSRIVGPYTPQNAVSQPPIPRRVYSYTRLHTEGQL